jgi:hypothetical protein
VWGTVFVVALSGTVLSGLANFVLAGGFVLLFLITSLFLGGGSAAEKTPLLDEGRHAADATVQVEVGTSVINKPRQHYIDKIRVWLTVLVVMHHSAGACAGQGWPYGIGMYVAISCPTHGADPTSFSHAILALSNHEPCHHTDDVTQHERFANSVTPFLLWFMITNQSYFMCLFFFISGCVVPHSIFHTGPLHAQASFTRIVR